MAGKLGKMDTKEFELPETTFIRDIENRVFQSLVVQCLSRIEGVALCGGNIFDLLLGRDHSESVKGIHVTQDEKNRSVNLRVEVNVAYDINIPAKAEEIQIKIAQDISRLTALRVGSVHVIFKDLISKESLAEGRKEKKQDDA
ncbi:MAG: hypothetical protein A2Y28_00815 [Chlamydiae bacterium GWC2_50_10]|nr:MAG: hypothetical protein A2Z85_04770 [Chlamydiae bacterium GWA2_50_15]OGN54047.1 MAG: hypothetical protein A2098_01980 [Chlamydiae bacterium GWF2_49_8]OGN54628.1 MAG: hypothetical protein A2Y28_00815 [Chlamydiae bacterium GWC2_50_10]OGN58824.1 MAG: hypothetical protein A3D18_00660 [Chlamydiae bacterium RIFCSPHIGHO2_02_FULL_49_29]OGN64492.1 MAG: hypothetical protein A3E26_04375 [Chlamydiae bacterium RIFCSPHIGHO2_12_FULL_49_32]OGN70516.1 MAG: hypothetical protein A3I15_03205 [Chlamydiae bact